MATSWKRWLIFLIKVRSVVFQSINRWLIFLLVAVNSSLNRILVLDTHHFFLSDLLKQILILTSLVLSWRHITSDHVDLFAFFVFAEHFAEAFWLVVVGCLNADALFVGLGSVEGLCWGFGFILLSAVLALANHILLAFDLLEVGFTALSLLPKPLEFFLNLIRIQIVKRLVYSLSSLQARQCLLWRLFSLLVELLLGSLTGSLFSREYFSS